MNPETSLQNKIIVALCENGCVARNHTVGQFYTKYGGTVNVGHHGEADVWGHRISDGKAFYIEVKLPGEQPREDQKQFLQAMARAGAISGVAHSIEEALEIIGGH
ncbi:MAG: VRR-NUC domain-containing protein [Clostridia bacterium]|nr:MAG: VRR-NUC domain-containing protein [Clostridia bacterium]PWM20116.1 MAG: VRR-NUC domain-containing protein [Clostridia bacterium]